MFVCVLSLLCRPRFWVGRVVEIKRGGKIRLHWFKETRLTSGMYSGTNSYFVERASNLTPFISYAADKTTRTVALFPLVEVDDKLAASKKLSGALADPCNVVCCLAVCSADVTFSHFQPLSVTFQYAWVAFQRLITVLALYFLFRFCQMVPRPCWQPVVVDPPSPSPFLRVPSSSAALCSCATRGTVPRPSL
jgi:hypothetical protein